MPDQTTIFVVAFRTKDEALAWRGSQEYRFAITEVPIFPRLPVHSYWDQRECA